MMLQIIMLINSNAKKMGRLEILGLGEGREYRTQDSS